MAELIFPLQLKRQFADSLDPDMVFNTTLEMNDYLTNGLRYAGQVVSCLEEEGKLFVLNNALDEWLEIGTERVAMIWDADVIPAYSDFEFKYKVDQLTNPVTVYLAGTGHFFDPGTYSNLEKLWIVGKGIGASVLGSDVIEVQDGANTSDGSCPSLLRNAVLYFNCDAGNHFATITDEKLIYAGINCGFLVPNGKVAFRTDTGAGFSILLESGFFAAGSSGKTIEITDGEVSVNMVDTSYFASNSVYGSSGQISVNMTSDSSFVGAWANYTGTTFPLYLNSRAIFTKYDNTASGLTSENVNDAIDEIVAGGSGGQVDEVIAGTGINVDATDPTKPIVENTDLGSAAVTQHEIDYNHNDFLTDITNESIGDLSDVDLTGIQDGDSLVYDETANEFVPGQGGGGGTPGGNDTEVQFNDQGSFAGSSQMTFVNGALILDYLNALKLSMFENDQGFVIGNHAIDWANGNCQKITLYGDTSITMTPLPSGVARLQLKVVQDSTGGWDLSFTDPIVFPNGNFDFSAGGAGDELLLTLYWDGAKYVAIPTNYYAI
jgi:hypothetical protein